MVFVVQTRVKSLAHTLKLVMATYVCKYIVGEHRKSDSRSFLVSQPRQDDKLQVQ